MKGIAIRLGPTWHSPPWPTRLTLFTLTDRLRRLSRGIRVSSKRRGGETFGRGPRGRERVVRECAAPIQQEDPAVGDPGRGATPRALREAQREAEAQGSQEAQGNPRITARRSLHIARATVQAFDRPM